MTETTPRVSAIMTVYNTARWVARAIDSLLTQTYRDIEIILVDDGSTDDSAQIAQAAVARDKRVRFAACAHAGIASASNQAIGMARGEYIAVLDSDDIALPDRFARQVTWLDAHPDVAVLGGAMVTMDEDERKQRTVRYVTAPSDLRKAVMSYSPIAHPAAMMRRHVITAIGGYRSTFEPAQDYDLWLRVSEQAELANLPAVLTYHRHHPGQTSVTQGRRQAALADLARAVAAARRSGRPDPVPAGFVATAESIKALGLDDAIVNRIAPDL